VSGVGSPEELAQALDAQGYLADDGIATATYLAITLHRPLFLEGDAGVGKTALAHALSGVLSAPLIRLQCYEGLDAAQALYDWDFPRQLLHLRAVEAASADGTAVDAATLEHEIYDRAFLRARPLLQAIETSPSVLLVDEVDRADDEFEAFLLEVLSDFTVTIPELGTIAATTPPVVIVTSNRTREVHDALKRRCLYHWVEHPSFAREVAIVQRRCRSASQRLAEQVTAVVQRLRAEDLLKPPGVAETIDWAEALATLGAQELEADLATRTLGAVLKYREDQSRVLELGIPRLLAEAGRG
jgi:MoxR-like ATPase